MGKSPAEKNLSCGGICRAWRGKAAMKMKSASSRRCGSNLRSVCKAVRSARAAFARVDVAQMTQGRGEVVHVVLVRLRPDEAAAELLPTRLKGMQHAAAPIAARRDRKRLDVAVQPCALGDLARLLFR